MLHNPCKTLGFKKNMVYKIPPGGGGKPYPASGLLEMAKSELKRKGEDSITEGGRKTATSDWNSLRY